MAKYTRILACSLGLPNVEKQGIPTMDESNSGFLLQRRHKQSCTRENSVIFLQTTQGKVCTVEDAYKILRDENPAFPYKFIIFKKFRPPNVRIPRSSDCIQCACPKHTNVERKIAALNAIIKRLVIAIYM